ncbi:MAG: cysteine desulfurase family protein [Chloroflexota bacterium]|nr:cysteine desulfurase [Chloroflexota bacterium]
MALNYKREVYLDHAATTPVDPRVVAAILPCFTEDWGNPSSLYERGRQAHAKLSQAREEVAGVLHCRPQEVVFTSGGSESDNLALKGAAFYAQFKGQGNHIITSAFEHHAILHTAEYLEQFGFETTLVPVNRAGLVTPDDITQAIRPGKTILISIMYANNEIGTVQPLTEISQIARQHHILFHTDAVQAPGNLSLDVNELGVDVMSLAAHKFYGPKGVGVLYVRQGSRLSYQQQGGSQERKRRAGTENLPYIVGLARALTLAEQDRAENVTRLTALRDRLLVGIEERIAGVLVNGTMEPSKRLGHNLNVSFEGITGEGILQALDLEGIAVSSGSACNTGSAEPSHVLQAIGTPADLALGTLRFSLGKSNTAAEIDYVLEKLPYVVKRLRNLFEMERT